MQRLFATTMATAVAIVGLTTVGAATASAAQPSVASPDGSAAVCVSGQVCIYAGTTRSGSPTNSYTKYGTYKLYDQLGKHDVYNDQNNARFLLCKNNDGTNCTSPYNPGNYVIDLTPYNSIILEF